MDDDRRVPAAPPPRRVPDTSRTWFMTAGLFVVAGVIALVGSLPVGFALLFFALGGAAFVLARALAARR